MGKNTGLEANKLKTTWTKNQTNSKGFWVVTWQRTESSQARHKGDETSFLQRKHKDSQTCCASFTGMLSDTRAIICVKILGKLKCAKNTVGGWSSAFRWVWEQALCGVTWKTDLSGSQLGAILCLSQGCLAMSGDIVGCCTLEGRML